MFKVILTLIVLSGGVQEFEEITLDIEASSSQEALELASDTGDIFELDTEDSPDYQVIGHTVRIQ